MHRSGACNFIACSESALDVPFCWAARELAALHRLMPKLLAISQIASGRDHGWIDVFLVFRNNGLAVGAMIQMIALVVGQRH